MTVNELVAELSGHLNNPNGGDAKIFLEVNGWSVPLKSTRLSIRGTPEKPEGTWFVTLSAGDG